MGDLNKALDKEDLQSCLRRTDRPIAAYRRAVAVTAAVLCCCSLQRGVLEAAAKDEGEKARGKMEASLRSVDVKRQGLDCAERVKGFVHRMLERAAESRVREEEVLAAFGDDSG
jgi:hypothetical protein